MLPSLHQPSVLHLLQPAFFEEAEDSLRKMERLLLALEPAEPGDADDEAVNSIFRCAHSVKGGAADFGIADVAALAHRMEGLLDRWRRRQLGTSPQASNCCCCATRAPGADARGRARCA